MSAQEAMARLTDQASGNLAHFVRITDDGHIEFDFSTKEAKEHMYLVKKVHTKRKRLVVGKGKDAIPWEHEWVEVELHDSQAALKLVGMYHKLFTERIEHGGTISIPGFEDAMERAYGGKPTSKG